jgi:hypothetical protein
MKLCNIFLTAAVFLSVGIVFAVAEETADGEIRGETAQTVGSQSATNDKDASTRSASAPCDLTITLSQYRAGARTEGGRPAYMAGIDHDAINTALRQASDTSYRTDEERQVYDFAIPFNNRVTKDIGVTERNDINRVSGPAGAEAGRTDSFQSSENGAYSILAFEKKVMKDGFNRPQIMSGGFNSDNLKEEEKVTSSPLSTPLMMLLFMFAFYIIMVLATTVGIKLKD